MTHRTDRMAGLDAAALAVFGTRLDADAAALRVGDLHALHRRCLPGPGAELQHAHPGSIAGLFALETVTPAATFRIAQMFSALLPR